MSQIFWLQARAPGGIPISFHSQTCTNLPPGWLAVPNEIGITHRAVPGFLSELTMGRNIRCFTQRNQALWDGPCA
jgi:hypothetical protein